MLFLLNNQGVPSVAKWVKLTTTGASAAACTADATPPTVSLTAPSAGSTVSGSVNVTASG